MKRQRHPTVAHQSAPTEDASPSDTTAASNVPPRSGRRDEPIERPGLVLIQGRASRDPACRPSREAGAAARRNGRTGVGTRTQRRDTASIGRPAAAAASYDAVVVGARCAGAATAMLLARRGLRVLALDRARYGSDTLSTHALMRAGVLQLHRWGLLARLREAGTPPLRTTTFHYGDDAVEIDIKPRDGVDALYAPRRTVLDALLVDAARESGAEVRHETQLLALQRDGDGRVCGVTVRGAEGAVESIRAGIVIGADGRRSQVARESGARTYRSGSHRTGVVYGYWSGIGLAGNHWYYRSGVSAGAIPTNDGATCVFAAVPSTRFDEELRRDPADGYRRVLAACDEQLARAVDGARPAGRPFFFPGARGHMRRPWGPGWALVGDAAYFKDPLTAHGITDALRDAELLAAAVARGGDDALARYQERRDALSRELFDVTDAVASFDWDLPRIQRLHRRLSEEMNREVEALLALDSVPPASRSA